MKEGVIEAMNISLKTDHLLPCNTIHLEKVWEASFNNFFFSLKQTNFVIMKEGDTHLRSEKQLISSTIADT
jgi:uncharacterized protein YhbP (UPF0306 family)